MFQILIIFSGNCWRGGLYSERMENSAGEVKETKQKLKKWIHTLPSPAEPAQDLDPSRLPEKPGGPAGRQRQPLRHVHHTLRQGVSHLKYLVTIYYWTQILPSQILLHRKNCQNGLLFGDDT